MSRASTPLRKLSVNTPPTTPQKQSTPEKKNPAPNFFTPNAKVRKAYADVPANCELVFTDKIGSGAFGVVYRTDLIITYPDSEFPTIFPTAAKEIFRNKSRESAQEFIIYENLTPEVVSGFESGLPRFIGIKKIIDKKGHEHLFGIMQLCESIGSGFFPVMIEQKTKNYSVAMRMIANFLLGISKGLETMHHCGIVHRDLKKENVALYKSVNPKTRKEELCFGVLDFGCATQHDKLEGMRGTLAYIAPEVMTSDFSHPFAVDMYSVGQMLRELLEIPIAFPTAGFEYEPYIFTKGTFYQDTCKNSVRLLSPEKYQEYQQSLHEIIKNCKTTDVLLACLADKMCETLPEYRPDLENFKYAVERLINELTISYDKKAISSLYAEMIQRPKRWTTQPWNERSDSEDEVERTPLSAASLEL